MRRSAAPFLDVSPQEFTAGIFTGSQGNTAAFLADTLENGAGYSTHLAKEEVVGPFLAKVAAQLDTWSAANHAQSCSASCYGCLRDYSNMAYHALLDWRLARDLFTLLRGQPLDQIEQISRDRAALSQFCHGFDGQLLSLSAPAAAAQLPGGTILLARHPLESAGVGMNDRLRQACDELRGRGDLIVADSFLIDRDPGAVYTMSGDPWAALT